MLDSFVYGELRKQASWHAESKEFYHYRDKDQYEVDMVMENSAGWEAPLVDLNRWREAARVRPQA